MWLRSVKKLPEKQDIGLATGDMIHNTGSEVYELVDIRTGNVVGTVTPGSTFTAPEGLIVRAQDSSWTELKKLVDLSQEVYGDGDKGSRTKNSGNR